MGEYDYTRSGNPTRSVLQEHLARLMKATDCLCVSSGMSALDVITRLVKSGEEIITGIDLYGGTNRLLMYLQKQSQIVVHFVDTTDTLEVIEKTNEKTRLVLLETPTNPLMQITDIPSICKGVKQKSNCLVCVDNTMMSPYLQNPLELGADIVYHSGTKYLSGHHDLMAGVIGVKDEQLARDLYYVVNATGCALAPFESFLLLRGVKTLALRMEKQQSNCLEIAKYLEQKGFKVNYPGLLSHPQYHLHQTMARGPGAVLSFQTGDIAFSERITNQCKIFAISVSFGAINSLISMPGRMSHASIPQHVRQERGLAEDLIRLCIGIEDVQDLIDDLEQSIQQSLSRKE
ncbi:cystathionine beta-lyase [Gorgonomyces haynaldii]|nr:cystathionine beta-lyase [Gorgonomyces haynaldii]